MNLHLDRIFIDHFQCKRSASMSILIPALHWLPNTVSSMYLTKIPIFECVFLILS